MKMGMHAYYTKWLAGVFFSHCVYRRTALHWATVCENPEVIRALLHHGSNQNIRDSSGRRALEYATEKGLHYCGLILTKAEDVDTAEESATNLLNLSCAQLPLFPLQLPLCSDVWQFLSHNRLQSTQLSGETDAMSCKASHLNLM